ncbi:MAG TPA: class I tRNA ligase family protein, partial [bacterium]|nr:class I tRNA ligase family protein [bacterium]
MYEPVPKIPDFPALERRHLAHWAATDAFARRREKNRGGEPWSFLDGPITANNPMGVHHAWGRSYKDMFQRFHAMNGHHLRYQNGFDCQGLWVEVEVEKEHGFETKADILDYGLDRFVRACKERVLTYAARQTEQSIRLGYWTDWDPPATLLELRDALREGRESVTVTMASGETVTGSPEEIVGRLGCPEFGGSYFTFSTENNYTIWAFLRKCHDEGFVYRGHDVMPWCTRCGTGLSQMEVTEGRKITSHTSVFVRFPLHGREREALLVWTTTPWTLTSNVAAAVNPGMTYLRVRHGDWVYYVGKGNYGNARVQELEAAGKRETHKLQTVQSMLKGSAPVEVLGEVPGSDLLGLHYDGPFDHLPAAQTPGGLPSSGNGDTATAAHRVIAWSEVSEGEGTGIVHIAPGCGAEDRALGRELGMPSIAPLTEGGDYLDGFGEWSGRNVQGVADDLVADLKTRDVLVAKENYPHVYPHCWRCKSELVFRLVDEWFIRMDWRDRIRKVVPDIRWIPADGEAREQDWLRNMGDWMISKKRFWGLALPIWRCNDCEWFTVIGGEDELREKAVAGWEEFQGHAPHRPWIDRVEIRCEGCGANARRVEDVGNPWLDAGIVPFSTVHYNTDREYWSRWFPADFVVESFPGQFRNWFYSLLAMSAMMDGRAPFRVLLGHATVRDERGEEMHKSSGNSIAF